MSAAGIGAGAAIVGAGMSIFGNISANSAQTSAEQANADFYQYQSDYARKSMIRDLAIYKDQAAGVEGNEITGAAVGGVNLSGSPMLVLATSASRQVQEEAAIRAGGNRNIQEAYLRAGASQDQANRLGGFEANALPAFGSALGAVNSISSVYSRSYASSGGGGSSGGGYTSPSFGSYSFGQFSGGLY